MTFCLTICTLNWSLTKDIVTIIGTAGALSIGVAGLSTWRRQLRGASQYDVAKRAVLLTYQVQDALQGVRRPMLYLRKEEIESGRKIEEEQRIYDERMRTLLEKWADLRTLSLEARVIWGQKAEEQFRPVKELIGELRAEIWMHFWLKGSFAAPGTTVDNNPERVAANDKIVYKMSEDDDFSKRIDAVVYQIENFFSARIRG
jgi:hypothetical protein